MTETDPSREVVEKIGSELAQFGCLGERARDTLRALLARAEKAEAALTQVRNAQIKILQEQIKTIEWGLKREKEVHRNTTARLAGKISAVKKRAQNARNDTLREAAEIAFRADDCYLARNAILALLDTPAPEPDQ